MGTTITLTAGDGHELSAYRAEPEGDARGGVVVIQEIFGVNSHIRSVADGYAAQGYVAVAPALFDRSETGVELGYDAEGIDKGKEIAFAMDMDVVMLDVAAAADNAASAGKVGIVGYCWGGSISYVATARLSDKIAAGSGYYGGQILPFLGEAPQSPLILHFGELDAGIPLENVDKIRQAHPTVPIHVYEGADHGFNCDARGSHNPDSAAVALDRTLTHFAEHLS